MFPEKFELIIPASERPKTNAIDRATIGTGISFSIIGSCDWLTCVGPTGVA
jgi:hypothetical protein